MRALVLLAASLAAAQPQACIFEGSTLKNATGDKVPCSALVGQSVALYFAGEWCPLCRRFTPALKHFYGQYHNEVALVFVSSDDSADEAREHYKRQTTGLTWSFNWLSLDWGDPLAAELKKKHKVWSGREVGTFGFGRRSGVPCVVVIDREGRELSFLQGERYGAAALREWEPKAAETAWRSPDEL